ncbi:hypothetical protein HX045_15535 [Myroides odoratimimus]|uniref:hypothetical protein n=1 Tax=Myroides odoratimimus TaxID=76832 RepID=UPI002574E994|nr:hypothetical protein [Myroides odoratimimus]MDM1465219.1 hypothetical protein [Myroides odoratimimus]MDM1475237.1 hypothetical protein [Myroides odoratimimus]MDM1485070.1 hypothetical protein [Myroides odoratimimus]
MQKKILIFGGIGGATTIGAAIIDANKRGCNEFELAGYVNDSAVGEYFEGYPVLGGKKDIPRFIEEGYYFLNTVYKVDGQIERTKLFDSLCIPIERLAIFIHPLAYVAPNVELSPGCVVMPGATISSNTKLGICCRVMAGAFIGHDNIVGDHCFFAANSCLASDCIIDDWVYFGFNCTTKGRLNFGKYSVIGAGSVVTHDVKEYSVVVGNPARLMRFVKDKV